MNITVCGAGPAGLGISACLMSKGHSITLFDMGISGVGKSFGNVQW